MKKFVFILAAMMTVVFKANAEVINYVCGENCTATLDEKGVLRVSGTGVMDDYSVANRADGPFYQNMNIKTVIIEDGITRVGENIFSTCGNLKKIELADSVQVVGEYAFDNISNIQSVTMSDNTVWYNQDEMNVQDYSNEIRIYCRGDLAKCTENLSKKQLSTFKGAKAVYKGKRIYSVNEANNVTGKKNKIMIRYK